MYLFKKSPGILTSCSFPLMSCDLKNLLQILILFQMKYCIPKIFFDSKVYTQTIY